MLMQAFYTNIFGAAARIVGSVSALNVSKFSTNLDASFAAVSSYAAPSAQVCLGFKISLGTFGQLVGYASSKTGSVSKEFSSSCHSSAAVIMARV